MKILMVMASTEQPEVNGRRAGLWLEEFAKLYYVFADAGVTIALASREGGQPPLDPGFGALAAQNDAAGRFAADPAAQAVLAHTARLADLHTDEYDALFYPCGHVQPQDLITDPASTALIEATRVTGQVADVSSQGPVVFSHARAQDGRPLVARRGVTGFGGSETAVQLVGAVPFLAADTVRGGAVFQTRPSWQPFVLVDGTFPGEQHPASSEVTARALLRVLAAAGGARQGSKRPAPPNLPTAVSAGSVSIR